VEEFCGYNTKSGIYKTVDVWGWIPCLHQFVNINHHVHFHSLAVICETREWITSFTSVHSFFL
jgi:hypothetical protein